MKFSFTETTTIFSYVGGIGQLNVKNDTQIIYIHNIFMQEVSMNIFCQFKKGR